MRSYAEFWPFYLREHGRAATRWFHFAGSNLALGLTGWALHTGKPAWLLAALLSGYAFAWVSHFGIEKNRPATFKHPLWSFVSDFRMMGLMWVGRLGPELERAGVPAGQPRARSA